MNSRNWRFGRTYVFGHWAHIMRMEGANVFGRNYLMTAA